MPRQARKESYTKVYHIILRGNNKQKLFLDNEDYRKMIKEIKRTKEKFQYQLWGYCLMPNHIHLMIFDMNNKISKIMQSIEIAYSSYYCKKYEKVGHLFQNRFLSKNVETKEYLVELCRYIHRNPEKAKIEKMENYKWSSYQQFLGKSGIVETQKILSFFGQNREQAIKQFIYFHKKGIEDELGNKEIEFEMRTKLTDQETKRRIEKILKLEDIKALEEYASKEKFEMIQRLKKMIGVSKSQIARITGISRKTIAKIMEKEERDEP